MVNAIVQISGKQLFIKTGQWYDIDYIDKVFIGDYININNILFIYKYNKIQIGTPTLKNIALFAKVIQQIKKNKITILKTKPKKNYTRKYGHRQILTRILVEDNKENNINIER